jgi:glycosyltransferase involved in cell wall biosynthesis
MRRLRLLSVVVPCYNEQEVIRASHERLARILDGLVAAGRCAGYELLYVDDGSVDGTLGVLAELFHEHPQVRVLSLRRNFGLQAAITAGLAYAAGDAVVTIDADLQDPPEKIGELVAHYEAGYGLVLGIREERSTDTLSKKFFAENYYRIMKWMGVDIVHNHGDFRLMDRSLVDDFNKLPERCRFVRAMILRLESRYAKVYYSREARTAGVTKFTRKVMVGFSLDGLVSFSTTPLRLASVLGGAMCLLSVVGIVWAIYIKISQNVVKGWASVLLPMLAIGGLQLFMLGVLGEYVGRLFVEVKQRPIYVVREELSHAAGESPGAERNRGEDARAEMS